MEYPKFSVLMSLYIKEKVEFFEQCMESILNQTVPPSEIVIVFDGPLTAEMYDKVDEYCELNPGLITLIKNKQNKGLGLALADGVPACKYDLIARMDTDDIARNDRFEIQLKAFLLNPDLDICGSHIIEFDQSIDNELSRRKVPLSHLDIIKYQKKRSAFNHMTVMYKKESVLSAGNYKHAPLMEDDLLWSNMIMSGCNCLNIDDYLVYARTGRAMIQRRGGWRYFLKYMQGRIEIYKSGFIGVFDLLITIVLQLFVALLPGSIREYLFIHLLRH